MVLLVLLLWSLCAVYITRFLYKRNLKVAAGAYVVLYVYLTAWVFVMSGWDVAQFGFVPDRYVELYAGDFYQSFVGLVEFFDNLSAISLLGIVTFSVTIAATVIAFLIIGGVHLVKAIAKVLQGKPLPACKKHSHSYNINARALPARNRIYLQYCRLNN